MTLHTRELQAPDVDHILHYWTSASPDFLIGMGVDLSKMPPPEAMHAAISAQLLQDYPEKQSYAIIWEIDGVPAGHSNVNNIIFGEEAYMHLHLWHSERRRQGVGPQLVRMTVPFFFKNLQLKRLYCEPYAYNPAPNRALEKAGFHFEKCYRTVPGSFSSEQEVNRWVLDAAAVL
jgi:[ribosomal protein S5]-alanine N-acetyltransferase